MDAIKTKAAEHSAATYITRCPYCGCEIIFAIDDCLDDALDDGTYQTYIICPVCGHKVY